MSSQYRTLNYYQNVYKRIENKKNFLKAYIDIVKQVKKVGDCTFLCSFLCCCCCSPLGHNAVILGDFARYWLTAVVEVYENQNSEKVKKLYQDALGVLMKVEKHVHNKFQQLKIENEAIQNKTYHECQKSKLEYLSYQVQEIHNDGWLHKIFYSIYNMTNLPLETDYLLTTPDIQTLFIAMPLFYPVLFKSEQYTFKLDNKIEFMIKDILTLGLKIKS